MSETITIESTAWRRFDIDCIANYEEQIKIGEREKRNGNDYYTKKISIQMDYEEMVYQRDLINHFLNECDSDCQFCKEQEENCY